MKKLLRLSLEKLGLEPLHSHPNVSAETYMCYHRPDAIGAVLSAYCRLLQRLGLARKACLEVATFDRLRPFRHIPSGASKVQSSKTSVILLDARSLSADKIDELADIVISAQKQGVTFKPIFLLGSPHFKPFREHGFLAEYLPPENIWAKAHAEIYYDIFCAKRTAQIVLAYAPDRQIRVTNENISTLKPQKWQRKLS